MDTKGSFDLVHFAKTCLKVNILGILFSGLVFPVLSMVMFPQPKWNNAEIFIEHFHNVQTLTFFAGYFLVISSTLLFVVLYMMANESKKVYALSGLVINVLFTSIVFINYLIQTTYIPYLANNNPPEAISMLPTFSMANPGSFAWSLEMYGWGGIGFSYVFMASIFNETIIKVLFWANGICSVAGAIITSINMNWLFSPYGIIALVVWNLLMLLIDLDLLYLFRTK